MKPSILEKLNQLDQRLEEVTQLLSSEQATNDMAQYRKLTQEHAELTPVIETFKAYQQTVQDLVDAEEMLADPEMKAFAQEEIQAAKSHQEELETQLQTLLLPKDSNDEKDI